MWALHTVGVEKIAALNAVGAINRDFKPLDIVVPHDFLLAKVWGAEYVGDTVNLRRYISYLRRKLQTVTAAPDLIHSEWGVGYRFDY